MTEISENTHVEIPLKTLFAIGFGIVAATTAFVTLDSRIISLEHGQVVQNMTIDKNSHFVTNWPLGNLGSLPDDLVQNAEIMAIKEKLGELKEIKAEIRQLQLDQSRIYAQTETQEEKIETLFEIYNSSVVIREK
jgi:predicted XRE-type DNA-binding protein